MERRRSLWNKVILEIFGLQEEEDNSLSIVLSKNQPKSMEEKASSRKRMKDDEPQANV